MENQTNFDPNIQEENTQEDTKPEDSQANHRLWYIVGVLVILALVSIGLYLANQDYFRQANQPITDQPGSIADDELINDFVDEEKITQADVMPPETVKQRFSADLQNYQNSIQEMESSSTLDVTSTSSQATADLYLNYIGAANAYRTLGDYEIAEQWYQKLINKYPDGSLAYHNLGVLYEDMHQYLSAARQYTKAIEINPINTQASLKMSQLYISHSSHPEKVKGILLKALQNTQNDLEVIKTYADYLQNVEENFSEALLYWQEALKQSPDNEAIKDRVEELKAKTQ